MQKQQTETPPQPWLAPGTHSQVPLPECKPDHALSAGPPPPQGPHIQHSMSTKRFINQRMKSQVDQAREVLRGSHTHPQPQICQHSSHGTTCSISFHNQLNETPLKASQYQNSQHVTLEMGRTEAFFWSLKSVFAGTCTFINFRKRIHSGRLKQKIVLQCSNAGSSCTLVEAQWPACCLWTRRHTRGVAWAKEIKKLSKSLGWNRALGLLWHNF